MVMANRVPALKVSIYVSEGESHRGVPVSSAILNFLFYRGIAGAIVTKGSAGFGAEHRLRSSHFVEISDHLPILIQFIDIQDKVEAVLDNLQELVGNGMMEIQETTILRASDVSSGGKKSSAQPGLLQGAACVMTIYIGESDRWNGQPLYQALVDALRSNDVAGVTVDRGILGYGTKKELHREHKFRLSSDLPIALSVVDTKARIQQLLPLLEQMIEQGLVVFSDAEVVAYARRDATSAS